MAVVGFKFVRQSTLHLRPTPFQYLRKVVPKSLVAVHASETFKIENGGGSIREEGK
ncbi:tRNA nucleotidyltransferase/poly(A) polymerase [Trifolium medium]|uniref:tRNA nucleotidyltransferase/poly(A) polymerase n=1 Tax=Trifolium medium TaxID=97028 RepID=A0A392RI16_9FABA|nr:tRNA nucleotidyltransferase/poly(A) polymerase [Trifolium medium]